MCGSHPNLRSWYNVTEQNSNYDLTDHGQRRWKIAKFGGRLLSLHYSCSLVIRMLRASADYDSDIRVVLVMKTVSHENVLRDVEWPISWQISSGQTYAVG